MVLSITREQSLVAALSGFDLAQQPSTSQKTASRVVHIQGSKLVATGAPIDVGELPTLMTQRFDNVWQVAVGSEVDINAFQIHAELSRATGDEELGLPGMVHKVEVYRQSVHFDNARQATIIEGGLLLQLRTDSIPSAGQYRLNIVLTSETY